VLDNAPFGAHLFELGADGRLRLVAFNRSAPDVFAIDHEALLGVPVEEFPGNLQLEASDAFYRVARAGGTWAHPRFVYDATGADEVFDVSAASFGPGRVAVYFRNVTEIDATERALQRSESELLSTVGSLARAVTALKVLSACNEALVRATAEQALLDDICDIAVEQGGYVMAWVGYAEHDGSHLVRPVARSGHEVGYLTDIIVTWDDAETGRGIAGTSIKTVAPTVARSVADDPLFTPWKHEALARGYRSAASFPLVMSDGTVLGAILLYAAEIGRFGDEELPLLVQLASDLAFGIETLRSREARRAMGEELGTTNRRLEGVLRQVTAALGRAVDARDPYTSGHQERVAALGRQIAEQMGMDPFDVDAVEVAGLLHDVGKLSIPAEILTKPAALSELELRLIREHSRTGYEILKDIEFVWPVADIVLQHHERIDGSGYPESITGEQMLPAAKVLAIADVIEAMASHRPYRAAQGLEEAVAEIVSHPELYDAAVGAACAALFEAGSIRL
jgi:putative nucleotidyltransferase with HDIG domain